MHSILSPTSEFDKDLNNRSATEMVYEYLKTCAQDFDGYYCSMAQTQEGIAEALGITRRCASYAVIKLQREGLVIWHFARPRKAMRKCIRRVKCYLPVANGPDSKSRVLFLADYIRKVYTNSDIELLLDILKGRA